MQEKHNRVIFHGQVSQKTSPFSIYRKKCLFFLHFNSSQDLWLQQSSPTVHSLLLHGWLRQREKNVSAQSQLISASRNIHKSHVSLIPKLPVQTHCYSSPVHALQCEYLESLTASIPSGHFSVTIPVSAQTPPDPCSELPHAEQHSTPLGTRGEAVGSHSPICC